jgi:hypothetical protein
MVAWQPVVARRLRLLSPGPLEVGKTKRLSGPRTALHGGGGLETPREGGTVAMAECPRCGGDSANFIHGVCRACYMREYHQRRSAAAVTECPKCGGVSANFVHGVCRACYMRDYHQRRSAPAVTDRQRSPVTERRSSSVTDRQSSSVTDRRSASVTDRQSSSVTDRRSSPAADTQRASETPMLTHDSAGRRVCVECREPGIYARGLCLSCYMRDRRRRTLTCIDGSVSPRICVECGEPGVYARSLCQNCYMRDRRRHRRIKLRACAVCGASFESARRDALYCSSSCRQKAHRSGKTQAA